MTKIRNWLINRNGIQATLRACALVEKMAGAPCWRSVDRLWLDEQHATPFYSWLAWKLGLVERENWHHRGKDFFIRLTEDGRKIIGRTQSQSRTLVTSA